MAVYDPIVRLLQRLLAARRVEVSTLSQDWDDDIGSWRREVQPTNTAWHYGHSGGNGPEPYCGAMEDCFLTLMAHDATFRQIVFTLNHVPTGFVGGYPPNPLTGVWDQDVVQARLGILDSLHWLTLTQALEQRGWFVWCAWNDETEPDTWRDAPTPTGCITADGVAWLLETRKE